MNVHRFRKLIYTGSGKSQIVFGGFIRKKGCLAKNASGKYAPLETECGYDAPFPDVGHCRVFLYHRDLAPDAPDQPLRFRPLLMLSC